jgi:hypothetical protein
MAEKVNWKAAMENAAEKERIKEEMAPRINDEFDEPTKSEMLKCINDMKTAIEENGSSRILLQRIVGIMELSEIELFLNQLMYEDHLADLSTRG